MTGIVLALGLFNLIWGEKIQAGAGLGWDGSQYAAMVRSLDTMIENAQLGTYYAQRIFPAIIVRQMLWLSGSIDSNANIVRAFEIYNLALLVMACGIWKRIADRFPLSNVGRWIGFGGLFLSYEASKQAFYYPVLTDVSALFTALLLLMLYLEKKPVALLFTAVVGAFAWPVVSFCGALLLFFLRSKCSASAIEPDWVARLQSPGPRRLLVIGGITILALSVVAYHWLIMEGAGVEHACRLPVITTGATAPSKVPCSLERIVTGLPSLAAFGLALFMLVGSWKFLRDIAVNFLRTPLHLVMMAAAAVILPRVIINAISNPAVPNPSNVQYLLEFIMLPPSGMVLLPWITLTAFWGPLVLLLSLHWNECCIEARRLGPGIVAVLGLSLPLGLTCEPRFVTIAWPFLVLIVTLALERAITRRYFKYVLTILIVIYSKFWLPINIVTWDANDYANILQFPKQLYFMHYGLWMSWTSYLLQVPLVLASTIWLARSTKGFPNSQSAE